MIDVVLEAVCLSLEKASKEVREAAALPEGHKRDDLLRSAFGKAYRAWYTLEDYRKV